MRYLLPACLLIVAPVFAQTAPAPPPTINAATEARK